MYITDTFLRGSLDKIILQNYLLQGRTMMQDHFKGVHMNNGSQWQKAHTCISFPLSYNFSKIPC